MAWSPTEFDQTPWKGDHDGGLFAIEKVSREGDIFRTVESVYLAQWLKQVQTATSPGMKELVTRQEGTYPFRANSEKTPFMVNRSDRPRVLDLAIAVYRGEVVVSCVTYFHRWLSDQGYGEWVECMVEEVA